MNYLLMHGAIIGANNITWFACCGRAARGSKGSLYNDDDGSFPHRRVRVCQGAGGFIKASTSAHCAGQYCVCLLDMRLFALDHGAVLSLIRCILLSTLLQFLGLYFYLDERGSQSRERYFMVTQYAERGALSSYVRVACCGSGETERTSA